MPHSELWLYPYSLHPERTLAQSLSFIYFQNILDSSSVHVPKFHILSDIDVSFSLPTIPTFCIVVLVYVNNRRQRISPPRSNRDCSIIQSATRELFLMLLRMSSFHPYDNYSITLSQLQALQTMSYRIASRRSTDACSCSGRNPPICSL